jgi:hypothetical protein
VSRYQGYTWRVLFLQSMSKNRKKIVSFFIIITFIYILKEFYSGFNCGFPPSETQPGGEIAGEISRSQFVYLLEHEKFASVEELKKYFAFDRENRKYSVEVTKNAAFSYSYATITHEDLCTRKKAPILSSIFLRQNTPTYTFVSAVFNVPKNNLKPILCISKTPGWKKVSKPYLKDIEPVCGRGTTKVN